MRQFIITILIIILLVGCSSEVATPVPKATDSPTSPPTSVPSPSPTFIELPVLQVMWLPQSTSRKLDSLKLAPDAIVEQLDSMMVYKSDPVGMSNNELMNLADYIGVKGAVLEDKTDYIIIKGNNKKCISLDKRFGGLDISLFENYTEEYTSKMLQDNEYIDIAQEFLLETNLLTSDYMQVGSVIENGITTETKDGKEYSYPTEMTVTFRRKNLDGYMVGGVAPRIIVSLDLEGNIFSVLKIQREFTPYMPYPLKTIDEAIQDIIDGKSSLYNPNLTTATITSVELHYYNNCDDKQYLLPVYYIKAVNGEDEIFASVYAVKNEHLEYPN